MGMIPSGCLPAPMSGGSLMLIFGYMLFVFVLLGGAGLYFARKERLEAQTRRLARKVLGAGTVVSINGLPFRLSQDVAAESENWWALTLK